MYIQIFNFYEIKFVTRKFDVRKYLMLPIKTGHLARVKIKESQKYGVILHVFF